MEEQLELFDTKDQDFSHNLWKYWLRWCYKAENPNDGFPKHPHPGDFNLWISKLRSKP